MQQKFWDTGMVLIIVGIIALLAGFLLAVLFANPWFLIVVLAGALLIIIGIGITKGDLPTYPDV